MPHFEATLALCDGPQSVCEVCFSLNKFLFHLSLYLSLDSFWDETARTKAPLGPEARSVIISWKTVGFDWDWVPAHRFKSQSKINGFHFGHCLEGNGTPLQYSCLENPMDGGAWKAAVHGVAEGQTRLSDFTFTFHFHELEKEMATHSSVLAWRIPGTGEPGGLPSMGLHRVEYDWSDLAVWPKDLMFQKGSTSLIFSHL